MDQQLHMWRVHSTQKSIYCISVLAKSRTIVNHKVNKDSHIEVNVAVQGFVDFLKRECKSIMSLAFIYGRKFIFSRLSLQDTSPGFEYESKLTYLSFGFHNSFVNTVSESFQHSSLSVNPDCC